MTKRTKKKRRTKKNVYYKKIMKSMMSKIDRKNLNKKDNLLLDKLLNNLNDICKIYTAKK